ncbi:MAG TPA: ABC transporter ATP-binding protein [Ignavibacteriales bacterium]|nr:ABC transporter ATP-binding protein [Ignavibacteriales bacterium]
MADAIVVVNNLSKSFGDHVVLDNVSLEVNEAENLVVFGRSGTGKSVLLKCIIGLLKPDNGEIYVEGKNVLEMNENQLNELRKSIGFLFQSGALYDSMSVRENLEFPLKRLFKLSQKEMKERVERTLDMVSLLNAIDKMPSELSGGMRKRIALARSIISEPKLMLYDEPTTGLDPITTKEISELINTLQRKLKMTSIAVTHDIVCAKIIADRAIFLRDAHITYQGPLEELENSGDKFMQNFFKTEVVKE